MPLWLCSHWYKYRQKNNTEMYRLSFPPVWYRFGKYQEIPTEYRPKIPNRYNSISKTVQRRKFHPAHAQRVYSLQIKSSPRNFYLCNKLKKITNKQIKIGSFCIIRFEGPCKFGPNRIFFSLIFFGFWNPVSWPWYLLLSSCIDAPVKWYSTYHTLLIKIIYLLYTRYHMHWKQPTSSTSPGIIWLIISIGGLVFKIGDIVSVATCCGAPGNPGHSNRCFIIWMIERGDRWHSGGSRPPFWEA